MTPKDFSINIMGQTISTAGISKEGIQFNLLGKNAQKILSVFNTDADKTHLSKQELTNAILYFKKFDTENDETQKVGTKVKPDGYLNDNETQKILNSKNIKLNKKEVVLTSYYKAVSGIPHDNEYMAAAKLYNFVVENFPNGPDKEEVLSHLVHNRSNVGEVQARVKFLVESGICDKEQDPFLDISDLQDKTKIADKQGLKLSKSNRNIARGKDGKYYIYNEENKTFQMSNIKSVMKDGSYITDKVNKKAQHTEIKYSKDGEIRSITIKNYQNKRYANEKYAAKIAGLSYSSGKGTESFEDAGCRAYFKDERAFKWNPEKHQFEQGFDIDYSF